MACVLHTLDQRIRGCGLLLNRTLEGRLVLPDLIDHVSDFDERITHSLRRLSHVFDNLSNLIGCL